MAAVFFPVLSVLIVFVYADDVDEAEIFYRGNDLVFAVKGDIVMRHNSGNETSLEDVLAQLRCMRNQMSVASTDCSTINRLEQMPEGRGKTNKSSSGCILILPSCSGDGEVLAWQHATSTFACSSNLTDKVVNLESQLKIARSQLEISRINAASVDARLQRFISCQRQGMSYNETLDECMPMVPQCTRDGEVLVWNAGENRYRCSSFLVDSVNVLQTELKQLSAQALKVNQTGDTRETAGISCRDVLEKRRKLPSGSYWIEPTASGNPTLAFEVYCDMLTDGGGWTLVTIVKAAHASYEKKYPVNGMNEDTMLTDRTDKWASLSRVRLNQVYNAYKDTIMRVYTSAFTSLHSGDRSPSPRTYYLKKMNNTQRNFDAFRAIRFVPLWGQKTVGEYKLNYFRDGLYHPYDHVAHDFQDSNKKMHHWESHVVRVNGIEYSTSRHGIVGDAFSNCEWLYNFNFRRDTGISHLNCRTDSLVHGKIWIK